MRSFLNIAKSAGLGFIAGGPAGAIIGGVMGAASDREQRQAERNQRREQRRVEEAERREQVAATRRRERQLAGALVPQQSLFSMLGSAQDTSGGLG